MVARAPDWEWLTLPGSQGGAYLDTLPSGMHIECIDAAAEPIAEAGWPGAAPSAATRQAVLALLRAGVDRLVVFGGDGTLADVALALFEKGRVVPVLGVGCGTTNAGELVSLTVDQIPLLPGRIDRDPEPFSVRGVTGVLAFSGGRLLGIGFNDAVVGTTVLATVGGRARDVSVLHKMAGRNVPATCSGVGTEEAVVEVVRGKDSGQASSSPVTVARGREVGQVVVAPLAGSYWGKALVGGVCLASGLGYPGGVLVTETPIVSAEWIPQRLESIGPIVTRFVALGEGDTVMASGMRAGAALCVDGNPVLALSPAVEVRLLLLREAARVLRPTEPLRGGSL